MSGHDGVATVKRRSGRHCDPCRGRLTRSTAGREAAATTRTGSRATAADVELGDEKVEEEFDDERRNVEQAVYAAATEERQ